MKFCCEKNRILRAFSFVPAYLVVLWLTVFACIQITGQYDRVDENTIIEEQVVETENSADVDAAGRVDEKGRIDINTANQKMLEQLPEIGPVKAKKIVETRELMGGFRTVDDLLNVSGIGEKTLEGLRELVVIL